MTKAVLFDFGGTIDTDGIHWSEKFWDIYQLNNVPVTKAVYEKAYVFAENNMSRKIKHDDSFKTILERQLKLQIGYLTLTEALPESERNSLASALANSCYNDVTVCINGIRDVLESLSKKYALGVVSNFYGNMLAVLKEFGLNEYFSTVADSEIIGIKKPDPGIFIHALNELDVEASSAFVVGDSYDRDIQPAKKAGCKTIWIDGKSWRRPVDTQDADFTIHSLRELNNIIN